MCFYKNKPENGHFCKNFNKILNFEILIISFKKYMNGCR